MIKKNNKTNKKNNPKKPAPKQSIISKAFKFGVLSAIWGFVLLSVFFFALYLQLPSPSEVAGSTTRTANVRILDKNGIYLANYGDGYGKAVNAKDLPKYVSGAFVATEDKRFYQHDGIDFRGIARAFYTNILAGRVKQGGSTISQQVAKNLFLSNERTFIRKAKELIYTVWLEIGFTKNQILSLYLNRVYMGSGQYGISSAAKHYFGVLPQDLNIWQSAVLAGMMKAPNGYNPIYRPKKSAKRARVVLNKMYEAGVITKKQVKQYSRKTVKTVSKKNPRIRYFTDYVNKQIKKILGRVNQDMVVYTTLDMEKQKMAYKAIDKYKKSFRKQKAKQVAFVSMDVSGAVRVMVGGIDDKSQFNRAVQAKRPVGSLFKAFVYANAMNKYSPETKIRDTAINIKGYKPQNYDKKQYGVVSLKYAFKKSLNLSAVKLSEKIGRESTIEFAKKIGIKSPIQNVPSMVLGTSEASLLEMTSAYGVFASGGSLVEPFVIDYIEDKDGDTIYSSVSANAQVVETEVISKFNVMAREVIKTGTGKLANIKGADIAGKTGTTQNYRDAWFIGYSSQVITGVWIGNDDNSKTNKISGGWYPTMIWKEYMKNIVSPFFDGNLM
ncbi:MAG: transglycosylase domain-containing protein [Alphaproteobacteria bacterium]